VTRLPDEADPDLLAVVRVARFAAAPPAAVRLRHAIALRRTDRRPFAHQPVPEQALDRLRAAAEQEGAHLRVLRSDQVALLTVAADRDARYAVLFTDTDDRASWLTAGEAMSAVLLTATADRLAASPMSDMIEVPAARHILYDLLDRIGHPTMALRIGVPDDAIRPPPPTPRRVAVGPAKIGTFGTFVPCRASPGL
jgi:hypothetical protein